VVKPEGSWPIQELLAKGKTGRVNASEPLLMPRHRKPADGSEGAGVGHAAEKRRTLTGRPDTGQRHRLPRGIGGTLPGRVLIVWNVTIPLGVRAVARCVDREEGGVSQRAKDDPRS
jgi:hypothetical protein